MRDVVYLPEAGDHEPSLTMLVRLARGLGLDFSIDITPDTFDRGLELLGDCGGKEPARKRIPRRPYLWEDRGALSWRCWARDD